jgi:hypothetical protein
MSFPNDRTYTPDINNFFADNAAAITASGYTQVGGATATLDLGGNQGTTPVELARIDAVAVCDVTALNIVTGDEYYKIRVVVSNDSSFGAGNVVSAGGVDLAAANTNDIVNAQAAVTGRYEVFFSNNVAGSIYEFARVYVLVGGTNPSINIDGFVAVLPEI